MLEQVQRWPVAEGLVLHTDQGPDADGAQKVTLRYMYKVDDKSFLVASRLRPRAETMRSGLSPDAKNQSSRFAISRISRRFAC